MKKYGIFLIPPAGVCQKIVEIKNEVASLDRDATYLTHPVHTSVFLFNTSLHLDAIVIHLGELLSDLVKFEVEISGWYVFYNDILTHKHTLTMGLVRNQIISNLQTSIAKKITQLPTEPIHYDSEWKGEYLTSFKLWGYPFVGSHWIPHITIASVENKSIIEQIQQKFPFEASTLLFSTIALFLIDNDEHTILHSFDLK